ncbi:MAG: hypothetical protein LBH73_00525, partial [Spirochaetaceae bacterium]|nr:hypothetical protein [Spirochaetaceae bacterium]
MKKPILLIIALFYLEASLHSDDEYAIHELGINFLPIFVSSANEKFTFPSSEHIYRVNYGVMTKDDRIVLYQEDIDRRKYPYNIITKDTIWRDQNGFPRARFFGRDTYFLMGGNRVTFKFLDETESGMVFLPETCRFLLHEGQDIYSNGLEVSCSSYLVEGQRRYVPVNMTQTFIGVIRDGGMIFNTANIPWAEGESGPGIGVA